MSVLELELQAGMDVGNLESSSHSEPSSQPLKTFRLISLSPFCVLLSVTDKKLFQVIKVKYSPLI